MIYYFFMMTVSIIGKNNKKDYLTEKETAMKLFQKKTTVKSYDKENKIPIIKANICNGEQITGFKDIHTGKIDAD